MEWKVLQYFLTVVREQSIVRAEEILKLVNRTEKEMIR